MAAQWNVQQAVEDLRTEMNKRFDRLDAQHLQAVEERAMFDSRLDRIEQKAKWIGAGVGAAATGAIGLGFTILKSKMGL